MSKVTSKLQVSVPKSLADQYGIRPGDDLQWEAAGDIIRVIPTRRVVAERTRHERLSLFDQATHRQELRQRRRDVSTHSSAAGRATNSTFAVTSLIDINILVYRFDDRYPEKQTIATETLRRGIEGNSVRLPHQAIVEFVAAVTRVKASDGLPLLPAGDARREAEEFLSQFDVLYPTEARLQELTPNASCSRNCGRAMTLVQR